MNELTLAFTNAPDCPSPVDAYIAKVIEEADNGFHSYNWKPIPKSNADEQGICFWNTQDRLHATLIQRCDTEFTLYSLMVRGEDGEIVYTSTDIDFSQDGTTSLGRMYSAVQVAIEKAEQEKVNSAANELNLEAVELTDRFITALLQDARSQSHRLFYERDEHGHFVADSFGIGEARITVSKDWSNDIADQHTLKIELPDGTKVLSCTDKCKLDSDEEEELRELYRLLEQQYPSTRRDVVMEDAQRFIDQKAYDVFLDRLLSKTAPLSYPTADNLPLVSDILRTVSPQAATQRLMEEVTMRRGMMLDPDRKRIRDYAEGIATIICATKRSPSGATYWTEMCNHRNTLEEIANAKCGWVADVFGGVDALSKKHIATRCAVLILASIIVDQLP